MTEKISTNYVAIDMGGTHIRVGSFGSLEIPTFRNIQTYQTIHEFKVDFAYLCKMISACSGGIVDGIALSLPGTLNNTKDSLLSGGNVKEWIGKNVRELLESRFHCPVVLESDSISAATAEALYGQTPRQDFLFVIWGTGVGGAVVRYKPLLDVQKLNHLEYFAELENDCGGKSIHREFGLQFSELDTAIQKRLTDRFIEHVTKLGQEQQVSLVVVGGGIAKYAQQFFLANTLVPFSYTALGESFGLYGAAAILALSAHTM